MSHTNQDQESIITRQKQDIANLTQKLQLVYGEATTRERALAHVRTAIQEAISMAKRVGAMLPDGNPQTPKRRAELQRLEQYFREAVSDFESVLAGYPKEPAERPNFEDIRDYASEGAQPSSAEQEPAGDSGKTPPDVDGARGSKKQEAK